MVGALPMNGGTDKEANILRNGANAGARIGLAIAAVVLFVGGAAMPAFAVALDATIDGVGLDGHARSAPPLTPTGTNDAASFTASSGDYTLRLICQGVAQNAPIVDGETGCPAYVQDIHDAMSQPRLVVDPDNPNVLGFSALHGGQAPYTSLDGGPPSMRSRADEIHQPHTTFRSVNAGRSWQDMPYYAPESIADEGDEVYGEDNAITIDDEGRVTIAAVYAHRAPRGTGFTATSDPYDYTIALWKSGNLYAPVDYRSGMTLIRADGQAGDDAAGDGTGTETNTDTTPGSSRIANIGLAHDTTSDRVLALWREIPIDSAQSNSTPPLRDPGRIHIAITDPSSGGDWETLALNGMPTHCLHLTDPIPRADGTTFGCVLDPETAAATSTDPTRTNQTTFSASVLRLHHIDLVNGTVTAIAELESPGNEPILFARGTEGHLVAAGADRDAQARPHVLVSYGDAEDRWTAPRDITGDIAALDATTAAENARITAGTYRPDSGHIHLITQVRRGGQAVTQGAGNEGTGSAFTKTLVVLRGEEAVVTSLDLAVGQVSRTDAASNPNPTDFGAFDDLHDGFAVWTSGEEVIEYIAYGDNGYVRFAEVTEEGFAPPPILVGPQTVAVPLTTAGASPAVYGSAAAVLSSAMVARFVARRNKVTTDVEVGA